MLDGYIPCQLFPLATFHLQFAPCGPAVRGPQRRIHFCPHSFSRSSPLPLPLPVLARSADLLTSLAPRQSMWFSIRKTPSCCCCCEPATDQSCLFLRRCRQATAAAKMISDASGWKGSTSTAAAPAGWNAFPVFQSARRRGLFLRWRAGGDMTDGRCSV